MYYYTKLSFLEQLDMNVSITIKPFYGTDPWPYNAIQWGNLRQDPVIGSNVQ
jgi:hypothetical protein